MQNLSRNPFALISPMHNNTKQKITCEVIIYIKKLLKKEVV